MNDSDNVKSDYEYSRDTYYELLEKGKESLDLMIEVARSSEHPRAFEVLSTMIKQISDVNDRLMDLNKKNKDLQTTSKGGQQKAIENQQNNIFVGSTADLQKLLQQTPIDITPKQ
jgi:DNA-binding PadR family transcriptional regulator